jgi:hypothetical protein
MTLARLLAAALVVCSLPVFAQDQQSQSQRSLPSSLLIEMRSGTGFISQGSFMMESFLGPRHAATPSEPWRLIPNRLVELGSGQIPPYKHGPPEVEYVRYFGSTVFLPVTGPIVPYSCSRSAESAANCQTVFYFMVDSTCYAILGYVAARDSKDSDSMHAAGCITCHRFKATEIHR